MIDKPDHHSFKVLTGHRQGMLVVQSFVRMEGKQSIWQCLCDCGNAVDLRRGALSAGQKSCGCNRTPRRPTDFDRWHMPEPTSGCWLWFGPEAIRGYGAFRLNGSRHLAHRYAWERAN